MGNPVIRILLVDDENELVDYLCKRLKKKGHEVLGVNSGKEALEQVKTHTFDVAILDLKMPEMDGNEALTRIKEAQPFLQAIMLTGHGSMDAALESGRHDALHFLVKPYEFSALMDVITEAWQTRREQLKAAYDQAFKEVLAHHASEPHELLHETARLKAKYEQN